MFKFIHAADLHLDSPLRGLDTYDGAPVEEIRLAARRACAALVDLAIDEQVVLVALAGDIYDGDWPDYSTGLFFVSQLARLRAAGIRVCLIAGNHDAANKMTRSLPLPENVTFFSHQHPESIELPDYDLVVHGQSFARAAETDDLSARYPAARRGAFNLGLLHTCAGGREGHERYAPCSLEGLLAKQYDYWALGHVHTREVLNAEPHVAFCGNLQGRNIRETGPKGCLLVSVDDRRAVRTEFRELDVVRWSRVEVDLPGGSRRDDALALAGEALRAESAIAGGRIVAARIELAGEPAVANPLRAVRQELLEDIRALATDVGQGEIWVEKLQVRSRADETAAADSAELLGPLDSLRGLIAELRNDPRRLAELGVDLSDLAARLPSELIDPGEATRVDDPLWLAQFLDEVEPLLVSRLLGPGATP
ncbi:MAG: DNA repair exonuclease [Pirellulales bacterium]|nr:DNA repair exonuclease [Pirellulales bacterium]